MLFQSARRFERARVAAAAAALPARLEPRRPLLDEPPVAGEVAVVGEVHHGRLGREARLVERVEQEAEQVVRVRDAAEVDRADLPVQEVGVARVLRKEGE